MMSSNTRVARTRNGNFKIVYLGKDQRLISVMKLADLYAPTWRRGATFNHLSKAIRGQLKSFTLADLVTVVANVLPISTESAMEEEEAAGARLRRDFVYVKNLEGSHFLDSKGKQKIVTLEEFSKRPEDLSYFVSFQQSGKHGHRQQPSPPWNNATHSLTSDDFPIQQLHTSPSQYPM